MRLFDDWVVNYSNGWVPVGCVLCEENAQILYKNRLGKYAAYSVETVEAIWGQSELGVGVSGNGQGKEEGQEKSPHLKIFLYKF